MQLEKKRVILRQTERKDLTNIMRLWNNGDVMKWVNFPNGLNMTYEKMEKWYDKMSRNNNRHHFVVLTNEGEFCGEVYYGVDSTHKRAELDIKFLLEFQGKGFASEAFKSLICHVFQCEKDIDAVWTEPNLGNDAAINLYTKCGLVSTNHPKDLEPHDTYYELTRNRYESIINSN